MSNFYCVFVLQRLSKYFVKTTKKYGEKIYLEINKKKVIILTHVAVHFNFYSKYYSRQNPGESIDMMTLYSRLYSLYSNILGN